MYDDAWFPVGSDLPLELQVALDCIVGESGVSEGSVDAYAMGSPELICRLEQYAPVCKESDTLVTLFATPGAVMSEVQATRPQRVISLGAGPLLMMLRPLRATHYRGPEVPAKSAMNAMGYDLALVRGIQGPAPVFWAMCERVTGRFGRPDLADRCRIGMLRTQISGSLLATPATLRIATYRRRL